MTTEDQPNDAPSQTTRRQFLTRTLLTAAGLSLTGAAIADALKAIGAGPVIVGQGAHRYEWVPDWLTPPPSIKWGDTQGIAQDSRGRMYLPSVREPYSLLSEFTPRGRG